MGPKTYSRSYGWKLLQLGERQKPADPRSCLVYTQNIAHEIHANADHNKLMEGIKTNNAPKPLKKH
jgi:hypothetical protein